MNENFLKQVSKIDPRHIFYRRFLLPEEGYTNDILGFTAVENEVLNLPFPRIFLEYYDNYEVLLNGNITKGRVKIGIAVTESHEQIIHDSPSIKLHPWIYGIEPKWILLRPFFVSKVKWMEKKGPEGYYYNIALDPYYLSLGQTTVDICNPFLKSTIGLLNVLACSNVSTHRVNKKKEHSGKPKPYDSYWELVVERKEYDATGIERPHRSPREHIRRGHVRKQPYKEGIKSIWIQPTLVNPGTPGKIYKDYVTCTQK